MTNVSAIFKLCVQAIRDGKLIEREGRTDKEFHFQDWFKRCLDEMRSAIYLPRFLEDLEHTPDAAPARTVNAMFKHVRLTAKEICELGREQAQEARAENRNPEDQIIREDQERKEARAIKLNSASLDITERFNGWYRQQRRHTIDYQADGDYFRIWIADDRRPGVKIVRFRRLLVMRWYAASSSTKTMCWWKV